MSSPNCGRSGRVYSGLDWSNEAVSSDTAHHPELVKETLGIAETTPMMSGATGAAEIARICALPPWLIDSTRRRPPVFSRERFRWWWITRSDRLGAHNPFARYAQRR
jgi:hypothetical protein